MCLSNQFTTFWCQRRSITKLPARKAVKGRTGEQSAHQSFTEEDALLQDFSQEDERGFQTESLGRCVSEEAGFRESNGERSSGNSSSSDDGKDSVGSENGDDSDSIGSENGSSIAVIKCLMKRDKRREREQRRRDKHQRRKEEAKDEKILSLIENLGNSRRRRSPSPSLGSSISAAFPTSISFPEATPKSEVC